MSCCKKRRIIWWDVHDIVLIFLICLKNWIPWVEYWKTNRTSHQVTHLNFQLIRISCFPTHFPTSQSITPYTFKLILSILFWNPISRKIKIFMNRHVTKLKNIPRLTTRGRDTRDLEGLDGACTCRLIIQAMKKINNIQLHYHTTNN